MAEKGVTRHDTSTSQRSALVNVRKRSRKVKIYENARDRRRLEDLADLFGILRTVQHLERAYVRDAVSPDEYTEACLRFISQFKTTEASLLRDGAITCVCVSFSP